MTRKLEPGSFYGRTEHRCDIAGLALAETVYPAGLTIPPHEHANPFFCFLIDGCSTQLCARQSWTGGPRTLMLFPAGLAHANHWHDSGGRVLHVEFTPRWLERLRERTTALDRPAHYGSGPPVWLALRLLEEYRQQDDVSSLAMEGLVLELLAECSRSHSEISSTSPPPWLDRVREALRESFATNLRLAELATAAGVSPDHLARSFRLHHGCTIGEYVRRLRVEYACRQLATSDLPLIRLALDAGFTDQSHFTRVFKRHMGTTPAAFRHLHRRRRSRTSA